MSRIFASDSQPMKLLSKVLDLIILNIIFLICCIPIFTIGAALCGMYYAVVKVVRRGHGYVFREFFCSFRRNFWQATAAWLLFCLMGGIIILGIIMVALHIKGAVGAVLIAIYMAWGILAMAVMGFLFPVLSRFTMTEKELFQNSVILAVRSKGAALLNFLMLVLLAVSVWIGWSMMPILLFILPSLCILCLSFPMEKILAGCMVQEQKESELTDQAFVDPDEEERIPWYLPKDDQNRNGGKGDE